MKIKVLFSLLLSLVALFVQAQNKDLFWIHGLNGERNNANFAQLAPVFGNRDVFRRVDASFAPISQVQTRNMGIQAVADNFRNQLSGNPNAGNDQIIMIGHSMGGMVAKELDIRAQTGRANGVNALGVITMGAPLAGARIANSMEAPGFRNWQLGPGSRIHNFGGTVAYNLGRPVASGLLSSTIYAGFSVVASAFSLAANFNALNAGNIWADVLPLSGQSWQDLKTSGHSVTANVATATPKLNIYAQIPRPTLQTQMTAAGSGDTYSGVVNYTRIMYDIYRWIPGLGAVMAREAVAAEGYFLFTIHGDYVNLISEGVTYERRRQDYKVRQNITTCWQESRRVTDRTCRKWGWFRWLCSAVVRIVTFTLCATNEIIATQTVWYQFPTYPETDGVVAEASARADGRQWNGTDIPVENCTHGQLLRGRGENALNRIFTRNDDRLSPVEVATFSLR